MLAGSNECAYKGRMETQEFEAFARELVKASGRIIQSYFADPDLQVDFKEDESIVTRADREAEQAIRDLIAKRYPDHGVIGEEFGTRNGEADFVWVLDPIDGTISFANDCPLFVTLIGLLHQGQPILGVIHNPVLNQLCIGNGRQTRLNDRDVQIRDVDDLSEAMLLCTDVVGVWEHQDKPRFDSLLQSVRLFRGWGDGYGYLLLAAGRADIMLDPIMNPWDILPLIPVVRGAGGVITGWDGGDPVSASSCIAAGKRLHPQVLEALNARMADD